MSALAKRRLEKQFIAHASEISEDQLEVNYTK